MKSRYFVNAEIVEIQGMRELRITVGKGKSRNCLIWSFTKKCGVSSTKGLTHIYKSFNKCYKDTSKKSQLFSYSIFK
jgi:hypothetical protein